MINVDLSYLFREIKISYEIVETELSDFPVIISKEDGYYRGTYSGTVYRVCTDEYCFTAMFPTKEAAEIFINEPMVIGFPGGN